MTRARWDGWDDERFAGRPVRDEVALADGDHHEDVVLDGPVVAGRAADDIELAGVRFTGARLAGAEITDLRVTDSLVVGADLAGCGGRAPSSTGWRCATHGSPAPTWPGPGSTGSGCDAAGSTASCWPTPTCATSASRAAPWAEAFLGGARLERVALVGCDLARVDLDGSTLDRVDLRSDVSEVARLPALRGAIVDPVQVTRWRPARSASSCGRRRDEEPGDAW